MNSVNPADLKVGQVVESLFMTNRRTAHDQKGYLFIQDIRPWPFNTRDRGRIQVRGIRVTKAGKPDKRFIQFYLSDFTFADNISAIISQPEEAAR